MSDDMTTDDTAETFEQYATRERERLAGEKQEKLAQKAQLESEIADIDRELAAIDAYEAAKTGKQPRPARNGAAPRARSGSRREAILSAVSAAPDGLSRGELLEALGLKGDKSGEMSVSNALTALTKANLLTREGGKYRVPDGLQQAA